MTAREWKRGDKALLLVVVTGSDHADVCIDLSHYERRGDRYPCATIRDLDGDGLTVQKGEQTCP